MLGPLLRGTICLLAVSIVLCTVGPRSDASGSAAELSIDDDDDYGEDGGGGSSSFSFAFPETRPRGLVFGFYDETCPDAEEIVSSTVRKLYHADPNVAAALVRLFFHDCFIHGCDASVLLDGAYGRRSERDAGPNQSLRGFGAIDAIKRRVETACPRTVSCADILALAARDSLVLVGGPTYPVLTGRRDSDQGFYYDVGGNIPAPNATYAMTLEAFARRGFTERETVALLALSEPLSGNLSSLPSPCEKSQSRAICRSAQHREGAVQVLQGQDLQLRRDRRAGRLHRPGHGRRDARVVRRGRRQRGADGDGVLQAGPGGGLRRALLRGAAGRPGHPARGPAAHGGEHRAVGARVRVRGARRGGVPRGLRARHG
ncbi:hypothetical protein BS78_03G254200 [Paspalum vaginatum]|nr:hypothetical protein BS78_03G254200 [Paspalum vaginatum]